MGTVQYCIQVNAHVTLTICYFVMLPLHVSAPIGHFHGGHLQMYTFIKHVQMCLYYAKIKRYQLKCH